MNDLQKKWDASAELIDDDPMRPFRYGMSARYFKEFDKNIKIVEIGCGEGSGLVYLSKYGFKNLTGAEVSPERLERANQKLQGTAKIDLIDTSCRLPYADNEFDVAVSLGVIEHTTDKAVFMKEISRIVKPGGYAVINSDCYTWRILQILGIYQTLQPVDRTISLSNFINLFLSSGFEVIHYDTFDLPSRGNVYFYYFREFIKKVLRKLKLSGKGVPSLACNSDQYKDFIECFNKKVSGSGAGGLGNAIKNISGDENFFWLKKKQ